MRMWMLPPRLMCRKHLLGEHVEIHMAVACLRLGKRLDGFIEKNLLELAKVASRHDELVREMLRRGFRHASPLPDVPTINLGRVNRRANRVELARRCKACARLLNRSKRRSRRPIP